MLGKRRDWNRRQCLLLGTSRFPSLSIILPGCSEQRGEGAEETVCREQSGAAMQEPKGLPWLPGDREAQSGGGPGKEHSAGNAARTAVHSVGGCTLGGATRAARGPVVNGWNPHGFPGSRDIKGDPCGGEESMVCKCKVLFEAAMSIQ